MERCHLATSAFADQGAARSTGLSSLLRACPAAEGPGSATIFPLALTSMVHGEASEEAMCPFWLKQARSDPCYPPRCRRPEPALPPAPAVGRRHQAHPLDVVGGSVGADAAWPPSSRRPPRRRRACSRAMGDLEIRQTLRTSVGPTVPFRMRYPVLAMWPRKVRTRPRYVSLEGMVRATSCATGSRVRHLDQGDSDAHGGA
jgi:hypothetical protein